MQVSQTMETECPACGQELAAGELACPLCHALLHGAELQALAGEAQSLEAKGDFARAHELWSRSLAMLPPESKQAEWVRGKIHQLELAKATASEPQAAPDHAWARRLGPLAPVAVLLVKSKGLLVAAFKLKFLFSFLSFFAIYAGLFGWRYGLGIAVSLLIHELGHYADIRRRGLPAEMPVFLPGLGAYVRWNALGVTRRQMAQVSLAGPLAGWIAAAGCVVLYARTQDPLWAALARTGAMINVLNLIPVWVLDGGKAVDALGLVERMGLLAVALALWSYTGQGVFFLVAAGVLFRVFTKDKPKRDDWGTWLYFSAVMIALGMVLHAVPELTQLPARR